MLLIIQLRLINPALIRPHLFGLRSGKLPFSLYTGRKLMVGLYPAGSQKTATLVARVLSAMSFFSPRDAQRDPELALFSDIISSNSEMMLDYLSSSIHQDLETQEEVIGDTFQFVAARMNHQPHGIQSQSHLWPGLLMSKLNWGYLVPSWPTGGRVLG